MKKSMLRFISAWSAAGFNYVLSSAVLILLILSSCSQYQYITINGNTHPNNEQKFVAENDTAKIVYSFNGANFPVTVEVFNKLNKPLYVDWTKSALIIDGQTLSFWQDRAQLNGSTSGYTTKAWEGVYYHWGDISGTLTKDERVSFIAPQSYIKATRFYLKSRPFDTRNHVSVKKESANSSNGEVYWKEYTFDKQTSPLRFKSYITLSTDKDFSTGFHFTNSFWVKGISQTIVSPRYTKDMDFPKTYVHGHNE